ncbi:hypothetical protein G7Y89_g10831 [Cudoniella acicularis]|uniref:Heterokaryon incompatibility domain-containing protein n=1 Tax=Cudoniella acicularis TaxID=354080 RepID=A0A8H4W179_9HELO|nr:hypothetical protein G7Y89_g10831 [Cudoniella acicularis]
MKDPPKTHVAYDFVPITDKDNLWSFCPNVPAAILFAVLFAITSSIHIFQARHYRTPFCWAIIMGALWETISFVIRVPSIYNPTSLGLYNPWFLLFLLAPLWINAFDYMLLGRMVFQYLPDRKLYGLRAERMAMCFVILDVASFIIQIGGGLLVLSKNDQTKQTGLHIYTAGLALQQFFIIIFVSMVSSFHRRLGREASPEQKAKAKKLLVTLYLSLTLISIRIIYRLLEFAADFTSTLTQQLWYHEVWQYCFDATPMFFALILMNVVHPGTLIPGDKSKFIKPVETALIVNCDMAYYQYQPLANAGMTRLLKLIPCPTRLECNLSTNFNCESRPITCNIQEVSLADNPVYEALSYNWGDASLRSTIVCDGAPLQISSNLYLALNRFRHQRQPVLLWADAICINQRDISECNSQVRLMRQIYQSAQSVQIWLGEETEDSKLGFEFVPQLLHGARLQINAGDSRKAVEIPPLEFRRYYGDKSRPWDHRVGAFFAISARPWFRRVWIIQEVSVSKRADLVCGSRRVDWDDFVQAMKFSIKVGFNLSVDSSRVNRIVKMDLSRQENAHNRSQNLEQLLFRYQDFLSTDPRDKIYSLLGLVDKSDLERLNLDVDYELHTHDLYRRLAIASLAANRNLDILGACRVLSDTEQDLIDFLPSWVPDWRASETAAPLLLQGFPEEQQQSISFAATKNSTYIPNFSENGNLLCLQGHFLAQITEVGEPLPPPPTESTKVSVTSILYRGYLLGRVMRKWGNLISLKRCRNHKYINGETMVDAFWQTLIAGHYGSGGFEAAKANYHHVSSGLLNFDNYIPSSPEFLYLFLFTLFFLPVFIISLILQGLRGCEGRKGKESSTEFILRAVHVTSGSWGMATTAQGYLALVPAGARKGDEIGLFANSSTMSSKLPLNIVIVGGVGGGMSAATRARCLDETASINVFEKGPYVGYSNSGIPYAFGGVVKNNAALILQTPNSFKANFNIDVHINSEVVGIDPEEKIVEVITDGGAPTHHPYDKLILAQGAEPVKPPIEGYDLPNVSFLRTIPDLEKIKKYIAAHNCQSVAVIGGGFIGIEAADSLHELGLQVSIIEYTPHDLPLLDSDIIEILHAEIRKQGLNLLVNARVQRIEPATISHPSRVIVAHGSPIATDIVLIATGIRARTKLAQQAGLTIGKTGVTVNEYLQTSEPNIYAIGDMVETPHLIANHPMQTALAGPATRQGRIAADNIFNRSTTYRGNVGTSACKAFSLTVASTGLSCHALQDLKIPHQWIT